MKTHITGAEPDGFYFDLATHFDAEHVVTDQIRLDLCDGTPRFDKATSDRVNERAEDVARIALQEGRSVVYDGFLNSRRRRSEVRDEVMHRVGARGLLLCMRVPYPVIFDRLNDRYDNNTLELDRGLYEKHPTEIARLMIANIEWPAKDGTEPYMNLTGTDPTEALLGRIERKLTRGRQPRLAFGE